MLTPRNTWAYGKDLLDAVYNVETVYLHQNDVINNGREDCHHLTVGVVGAGGAGKTSLIRKLTDQPFLRGRIPTEILDTSTIDPVCVNEQFVEAETWKTVAEKTDTEDLISHRVNTTLDDTAIQSKGSPSTFVLRYFLFFFLVHTTCLATLAWGAQPLASMCLCMMYGFLLVSRSETMLRLGLGFATNMYIMVWYVATTLQNCCVDGAVPSSKIPFVAGKILAASIAWGLAAGFRVGLIPGMASGLSLIQLASTTVYTRSTIDAICPGSVDMLLFKNFSFASLLYWLAINISSFVIFILVNKRHNKLVLYIVLGFCVLTYYDHLQMDATLLKVNVLFPLFVMVSWPVTLHTISWTRSLGPKQKPAGLQKTDLINTTVQSFLPGIVVGACCGLYIMEGKIKLDTPNDFFECVAIPVLIFLLSRSCAINQYFSPSLYNNQKTCSGNNKKLHKCFKLLVRDFAGQMVYHCIHQPFLPRYGIFLCVFSWRRAKDCSLNFAEGGQQDGTDLCLQEILFWLKNISMHKTHPNARAGNSAKTSNILDNEDIKSIFLVATHADFESCGLSDLEKEKIMVYYKREIRKHTDVYTSMEFRVSATGEISVESSRDGVRDAGISTLKASLLHTAQRVIEHCFPEPVPIYFWCWLKQKRDRCSETLSPPCELLTESDINMDSRYMSVYPNSTFLNMINMFCDIGELFLVRNSDREGYTNDYYIFFDLQFLIDFMKDIITIDETKRSDALNSQEWDLLDQQGKGSLTLLEHHLSRFYKNRNMGQKYSYMRLDRQPLVQSMLQLDFMFIVGKDFYIPQLLPKYDDQCRQSPDFFRDVDELLWEYVFDFQEFDFHHEYVFFRLLAKCVNDYHCEMRQVYRNWASIYQTTDQAQPQPAATVMSQWFTISCEQRNKDGGQYNRIYLRASKDYGKQQSLTFLQHIADVISQITSESFAKLGGKLTMFYNCPNRCSLSDSHRVNKDPCERQCGESCKDNQKTHLVRIDPDGVPYLGVSDEVKDWLCVQLSDGQFNSLLSFLLNIAMIHVEKQFSLADKTREQVKAELVFSWSQGYDASLDALCRSLDDLGYHRVLHDLTQEFPL